MKMHLLHLENSLAQNQRRGWFIINVLKQIQVKHLRDFRLPVSVEKKFIKSLHSAADTPPEVRTKRLFVAQCRITE